jgi:adenine phosphoribosyltransferase
MKDIANEMTFSDHHGVQFWDFNDITTQPELWHHLITEMAEHHKDDQIDLIIGLDARGFLIAGALEFALGVGSVTARKPGKLPGETVSIEYGKEYIEQDENGKEVRKCDVLHLQTKHIRPGMRVLIVDDVLATGGTAEACASLVEQLGATVVGITVVIELPELGARGTKLSKHAVHSFISIVEGTAVADVEYCVDILAVEENNGQLILIERQNFPEGIAMPGGRIEHGETVEQAVVRELLEETGCWHGPLQFTGVLSGIDRDPRGVKISIVMQTTVDASDAIGEVVEGKPITLIKRILSPEHLPTNDEFVFGHGECVRKNWTPSIQTDAA